MRVFPIGLLLASVLAAGCDSPTEAKDDACPQTYEFGNYGCARLVASLELPPEPLPRPFRLSLKVLSADPGGETLGLVTDTKPGENLISLTRWLPPPENAGDTLTVRVIAKLLDDSGPIQVGVPLPVFAVDSIRHTVRFSSVGDVPRTDTLFLKLRRP